MGSVSIKGVELAPVEHYGPHKTQIYQPLQETAPFASAYGYLHQPSTLASAIKKIRIGLNLSHQFG